MNLDEKKGRDRNKGTRAINPWNHGRLEGLSGDEYECMKMKCLSQYGDSAGTQVTEECSSTLTLGG